MMRSKVHSVRERVAALRAALLAPTPEGLEAELPSLQLALEDLAAAERPDLAELRALARDLKNAQTLIDHGLGTQQGLARLLAASLGGYQPDGEPAPLTAAGTIAVEG